MDPDARFFVDHPDRKAHIRNPGKVPMRDRQRAVHLVDECELEFRQLGSHNKDRRRIILFKTDHPDYLNRILKIPFIAFADETIEDRDDILLPILHGIMTDQANYK